jgi:hypothetical protein
MTGLKTPQNTGSFGDIGRNAPRFVSDRERVEATFLPNDTEKKIDRQLVRYCSNVGQTSSATLGWLLVAYAGPSSLVLPRGRRRSGFACVFASASAQIKNGLANRGMRSMRLKPRSFYHSH